MSIADVIQSQNPLDVLAEEYVARLRAGERPDIAEFCGRDSERAEEIRDFLSAVKMLEDVRMSSIHNAGGGSRVSDQTSASIGQIGDYRLLREVGRGGMGIVYEAEQLSLSRRVALKVLPVWANLSPSQVQRFYREARAAAALHHTHIVPVFGVGEDNGVHYYVMQFIEGRSLDRTLSELRHLPHDDCSHLPANGCSNSGENETATNAAADDDTGRSLSPCSGNTTLFQPGWQYWQALAQLGLHVAEALDYAASQGILHRDIKPSNLLLDSQGAIWVTDFGLAKAADCADLTATGDVLGTLRYLAPERLSGKSDLRGDIYGLGMTLYEALTLRPAFATAERSQLAQRILHEEPRSPREINPEIPRDLETIVLKAIAKDPSDRYPTAAALATDLRLYLDDCPILSRRVGPHERLWRWCRRNPLLASLEAAVVLLCFCAVGILGIANARIRAEALEKSAALAAETRALAAKSSALLAEETARGEREAALAAAQVNEQLAQRRFYATQMSLAGVALQENEWARVLDALNSQRLSADQSDRRGFEWHYLHRQVHRSLHRSFRQQPGEIFSLAFSPDGQTLAVCSGHVQQGGAVQVWSIAEGTLLRNLESGKFVPHSVAYAPDGRHLIAGLSNGRTVIWDCETGREVQSLATPGVVRSVGWAPDGRFVAAGCENGGVFAWDTTAWKLCGRLESHGGPVIAMIFARDSNRLFTSVAWGSENRLARQHDLSGETPRSIRSYPGCFIDDVSPSGDELISHQWATVQAIDRESNEVHDSHQLGAGSISSLRLSADGKRYASAGRDDRMAILWDREKKVRLVQGPHSSPITSVALDAQGQYWASGSTDGEVKIWHYDRPDAPVDLSQNQTVLHLAGDTNGTLLLGGDFYAQGRNMATGEAVALPPARFARRISADGRILVACSRSANATTDEIQIWDRTSGTLRYAFRLPDKKEIQSSSLAISRTGRWLATHTWDGPVRLWELLPDAVRQVTDFEPGDCMELDFSPDERLLAAACQFGRVRLWDVDAAQALPDVWGYESSKMWCHRVAFSDDGSRLAAGTDVGVVRVFDVGERRLMSTLTGHNGQTMALRWFPDGKTLAVAGAGPIRLWDVEIGQESLAIPVPDEKLLELALSPDGTTLYSLGEEGVVRVFESRLLDCGLKQ